MNANTVTAVATAIVAAFTLVTAAATAWYAGLTRKTLQELIRQRRDSALPLVHGTWTSQAESSGVVEWATTILNHGNGPAINVMVRLKNDSNEMACVAVLPPGEAPIVRTKLPLDAAHQIEFICRDTLGRHFYSEHTLNDPSVSVQYVLEEHG